MNNITTFTDYACWEKLGSRWLNADGGDKAVEFFTDIGGVGDSAFVYCRVQSFGGCAVEVNRRAAFCPLFDGEEINVHSLDLSGMFSAEESNRVSLVAIGGGAVRAVFLFGDADGNIARLSTDEGWSAVASSRSFGVGEAFDARENGGEPLAPSFPMPKIAEISDSPVAEANLFVNPVKVYADKSRLRRVYDFGCELYGAPVITAGLPRGAKVRAVCADLSRGLKTISNPTEISPVMFREKAKILICSGFGSDRLYPLTGASRFRYVYALGDGDSYTVTAIAAAELSRV